MGSAGLSLNQHDWVNCPGMTDELRVLEHLAEGAAQLGGFIRRCDALDLNHVEHSLGGPGEVERWIGDRRVDRMEPIEPKALRQPILEISMRSKPPRTVPLARTPPPPTWPAALGGSPTPNRSSSLAQTESLMPTRTSRTPVPGRTTTRVRSRCERLRLEVCAWRSNEGRSPESPIPPDSSWPPGCHRGCNALRWSRVAAGAALANG